jgi:hypothetical protein
MSFLVSGRDLFCSVLFCSVLFCSVLFCSVYRKKPKGSRKSKEKKTNLNDVMAVIVNVATNDMVGDVCEGTD